MIRYCLILVSTLFFLVSCKSTDSANNREGRFKTSSDSQLIFDTLNNISWTKCPLGMRFENERCTGPSEKRVGTFKGRAYPSESHHYSQFGDKGHTWFSGNDSFIERIDEIHGVTNLRLPTVQEISSLLSCEKTNYLQELETGNGSFCKKKSNFLSKGVTPSILNNSFENLLWPNLPAAEGRGLYGLAGKGVVALFFHNNSPYWVSLSSGKFGKRDLSNTSGISKLILVQSANTISSGLVASKDSTGGRYGSLDLKDTPVLFIPWQGHKFFGDNRFSNDNLVYFSDLTWLTVLGYVTHVYQIGDHVVHDRYVKFRTESGQIVYLSYNDFNANDYESRFANQERFRSQFSDTYRSFLFDSNLPSYSRTVFWFNFDKSALELIVNNENEYHRTRLIEKEEYRKVELARAAKERKEKEREDKRRRDFAEQLKRPEPRLGMTKDAVRKQTNWGVADRTRTVQQVGVTVEFWYYQVGYSYRQLIFSDGVLIQIIR